MAQKLKEDFDIIVLMVELLDAPQAEPDVQFTLQCKVNGELRSPRTWTGRQSELGVCQAFDSAGIRSGWEEHITLPVDLLQGLNHWFHEETEGDRPLWVHLVKPYGALRLVPWERLLGKVLEVPILMLPDFIFPPPREATATLDIVLCASAPLGSEEGSIYSSMALTARRILESSPRPTHLHLFVDAQFADLLRSEWSAAGKLGKEVLVYDASVAAKYVEEDPSSRIVESSGILRSPWLLWMREALSGRAVDVVHFCCHGYLSRGRGALLFAQSPLDRSERYLAGPVGAAELQTFLTQVGAWSSAFTSVPDNFSEPGTRSLADQIAQSRPGPMLMHNLREDPAAEALASAYHFLYSKSPENPPRSQALFLYCQPYLSVDALRRRSQRDSRGANRSSMNTRPGIGQTPLQPLSSEPAYFEMTRNSMQGAQVSRSQDASPLDALFAGNENVPTWVASTERFAELVHLRYQELARDELLPEKLRESQTKLAMETVDKLRKAVANLTAKASRSPEQP